MFLFDEAGFIQTQDLPPAELWYFFPFGYLLTILIETPILLIGLSTRISVAQKFFFGVWLTACTYPVVVLILPNLFFGMPRWQYLFVAETFAPLAECALFWAAFARGRELPTTDLLRSLAAIVAANLASFGIGEMLGHYEWLGWF
ncbi:MAG: hypothetical protein ABI539_09960 [Acidobacteriota bacterium]